MIDPERVSDPRGSAFVLAEAFAFFAAGCVLLPASGASLATLHAFAAFVVLAIVAAANQLVPVLAGSETAPSRAVVLASAPLALGFAALIAAFEGVVALFPVAGVLLGGGALLWTGWTIARIARGRLEGGTRAVLGAGIGAFALAALAGAALAFGIAAQAAAVLRIAPAHAILAIVGFASTVLIAVSRRLVPMFALAHTAERRLDALPPWLALGAALAAAAGAPLPLVFAVALVALALGARTHLRSLRARLRRTLDVSLRYALVAWGCGFLAALCALASVTVRPQAAAGAVALGVLGWLAISIVGYAYKIVGFLAWQDARARAPGATLPALAAAVPEKPALVALALLGIGALATAARPSTASFALYGAGGLCATATLARIPLLFRKGSPCPKPTASSVSTRAASIRPSR